MAFSRPPASIGCVFRLLTVCLVLVFGTAEAFSATATWNGGGSDGNWSSAANWSTGQVPTSGDAVIFDGTSTKNAIIDVDVSVGSISINSGYTGGITQSASVTTSGDLVIDSGTWDAGAQTLTVGGSLTIGTGATWVAGTSTVSLTGSGTLTAPAAAFCNLRVAGAGATTTLASDVVVTGLCTVIAGTLDFHNGAGATLHLRGAGRVFDMEGALNAGFPNGGAVSYEATSSTPIQVEGISYGYASLRLVSLGGAAGVFDQTGTIAVTDDISTTIDTAGGSVTWSTHDHDVSSASWMSIGNWGSSAGGTTINAGSSHITVPVICWFTTSGDVVNMQSSSWRVANWATWTSGATVNVGTSSVTITGGDLGPAWAWWGVPHRFYDLVIDAGSSTVITHGDVNVQHDLTVANGTLDTNDWTISIGHDATVDTSGAITAHASSISVGHDLTIPGGAGHFSAGTSTVTMAGTGSVSNADSANAFHDLRVALAGQTTTLATDVTVIDRCTVVAGTLDFHNGTGAVLHLRGSGHLLDMEGSLNAGFPNGGGVSYEATSSVPMQVEGISYGYASLRLVSVGGASATFNQVGAMSAVDDISTFIDTAGGSATWNMNGYDVTSASWISIGNWGSAAGGTTINAGASHVSAPSIAWFTTSSDVVNMETSSWTVANWATWTSGATVNVGTSTVMVIGGDIGPAWAWWGVPHQFYNLVINSGSPVAVHGDVQVHHDLSVIAGGLDTNGWNLSVDGNVAVAVGVELAAGGASLSLSGSGAQAVDLGTAATIATLSIAGGNRTVSFARGFMAGSISCAAGPTLATAAGETITTSHLNLAGTSSAPITVDSGTPGTAWNLVLSSGGTQSLSYVRAQDSDAHLGLQIDDHLTGTDLGHNSNWLFPGGTSPNQPPSFTKGTDQTVSEDAGPQTVLGWATNISPGPPSESGQTVDAFIVSSTNTSLFSAPPAVSADGTLTYTAAPNANGTATVSVQAHDTGGTANGGSDTSAVQTFTITVLAVNDPPTIDAIADPAAILEDAGQQTVTLSGITVGPANESGQTLTVTATSSNTALIPNPTVAYSSPNGTGTLRYTPVANANGTAVITVIVRDDGGVANNGADTMTRTFTVTVTPVNDPPTLAAIPDPAPISAGSSQQAVGLSGISAGPANEAGQTLTVTATSSNTALIPNPTVAYTSPNNTGTLSYTPVANASGTAVITVTVRDDGGVVNNGSDTTTRTFTVTVTPAGPALTIDQPASATPAPVTGDRTTVSVLGSEGPGTEPTLTYRWSATGPAAVTFASTGTNAAKQTTALFSAAGDYVLTATVTDPAGQSVTSSVEVSVVATATTVSVSPANASILLNGTQAFSAVVSDQFGNPISGAGVTWSVDQGSITSAGLFTGTAKGPSIITATGGSLTGTGMASVIDIPAPTFTPASGSYVDRATIAMTTPVVGLAIYYTTVASGEPADPTPATGQLYSTPITITANTVIKAAAFSGGLGGPIARESYTIVPSASITVTSPSGAGYAPDGSGAVTVSPAAVEATGSFSGLAVTATVGGAQMAVTVYGDRLARVETPLAIGAPTDVTISAGGSPISTVHRIWKPLDLSGADAGGTVTIRAGDSLLFTANSSGAITLDPGTGGARMTMASGQRMPVRFSQSGNFTVKATGDAGASIGSYSVRVVGSPFSPGAIVPCEVSYTRSLTLTTADADALAFTSADDASLTVSGGQSAYHQSGLQIEPLKRGDLYLIARLGFATGAIVAAQEVSEFTLDRRISTRGIGRDGNPQHGGIEMSSTIRLRPYIPGLTIEITGTVAGPNGTTNVGPTDVQTTLMSTVYDASTQETIGTCAFSPGLTHSSTGWHGVITAYQPAESQGGTRSQVASDDPVDAVLRDVTLTMTSPSPLYIDYLGLHTHPDIVSAVLSLSITPPSLEFASELDVSGHFGLVPPVPVVQGGVVQTTFTDPVYTTSTLDAYSVSSFDPMTFAPDSRQGIASNDDPQRVDPGIYYIPNGTGTIDGGPNPAYRTWNGPGTSVTVTVTDYSETRYDPQHLNPPFPADYQLSNPVFTFTEPGMYIVHQGSNYTGYPPGMPPAIYPALTVYVKGIPDGDIGAQIAGSWNNQNVIQATIDGNFTAYRVTDPNGPFFLPGPTLTMTGVGVSGQVIPMFLSSTQGAGLYYGQIPMSLGYQKDGSTFFQRSDSTSVTEVYYLYQGLGAPDGLTATVPIIPGIAAVDVGRRNLYLSLPVARFTTPAMGPDCTVSYNSMDSLRTALGYGWRTNYDMRIYGLGTSESWVIDETGRRVPFARNATTPAQFSADASEVVLTAENTWPGAHLAYRKDDSLPAGNGWEAGERYRLSRLDDRWCFFDTHGRLMRISTLKGENVRVAFDADGYPKSATDDHNRTTDLRVFGTLSTQSGLVHLASMQAGLAGSWSFTYDDLNNLTGLTCLSVADATFSGDGSRTWTIAYDSSNNVTAFTLPALGATALTTTIDTSAGYPTIHHALGGTTTFHITDTLITSQTDQAGVITTWTYDASAGAAKIDPTQFRLPTRIATGSRIEDRTYDDRGNLISSVLTGTGGASQIIKSTYASLPSSAPVPWPSETNRLMESRVESVVGIEGATGPADLIAKYTYRTKQPALGELETTIDPCGATTHYSYDQQGVLQSTTDARGQVTTVVSASPYGQPLDIALPSGRHERSTWDQDGFQLSHTDAFGYHTSYQPDSFRRVKTVSGPGPATVTTSYDPLGRVTQVDRDGGDGSHQIATTAYDALGRVTSDQQPGQAALATTYVQTGDGWLITTTGPKSHREVTIDAACRVTADATLRTVATEPTVTTALCTTTTAYDSTDGWATDITDPDGGHTHLAYDGLGRVTQTTSPVGGIDSVTYNSLGWVLSTTDADGHTDATAYDACGRPQTRVNPAGGWSQTLHDATGNLVATRSAADRGESFGYDGDGVQTSRTDVFGQTRSTQIDADAKTVTDQGPGGQQSARQLDAQGRLGSATVSASGVAALQTGFAYGDNHGARIVIAPGRLPAGVEVDDIGRAVRSYVTGTVGTDPGIQIDRTTAYDPQLGIPTSSAGFFGDASQQVPDSTGEINVVSDNHNADADGTPSPTFQVVTRNQRGLVTAYRDAEQRLHSATYDASGRKRTETAPNGVVTTWSYSNGGEGNLLASVAITDTGGTSRQTTYEHDQLGDVITETGQTGQVASRVYDAYGRVLAESSGGITTGYAYDAQTGAVASVQKPGSRSTVFQRDARGRLEQVVERDDLTQASQSTTYHYDELDRVVLTDFPDGRHEAKSFAADSGDLAGVTESGTASDGTTGTRSVTYVRDGAGRVTDVLYDDGTSVHHDLERWTDTGGVRGQVQATTLTIGGGSTTTTRRLDRGSQLRSLELPGQPAVTMTYDGTGLITARGSTSFGYNAQGQLTGVSDGTVTVTATYDARGLPASLSFPDPSSPLQTIVQRSFGYDDSGRLTSLTQALPFETMSMTASYDSLGRMRSQVEHHSGPDDTVITYGYDALSQLAVEHVSGPDCAIRQFAYDRRGNRSAQRIVAPPIADSTHADVSIAPGDPAQAWTGLSDSVVRVSAHVSTAPSVEVGDAEVPSLVASLTFGDLSLAGHYAVEVHALATGSALQRWIELHWIPDVGEDLLLAYSDVDSDNAGDLTVDLMPKGIHAELSSSTGHALAADAVTAVQLIGSVGFAVGGHSATAATFSATGAESAPESSITLTEYTYAPGDRLAATATSSNQATLGAEAYGIDAFGRVVRIDRTGAGAGSVIYGYDRLDRMTSLTQPGTTSTFSYVGDSWMRSSATENGVTSTFQWDGRNMTASTVGGVTTNYTYMGNKPLWFQRGGATTFYAYDILGNVNGRVYQIPTGQSGMTWGLVNRYKYDAWGNTRQFNISNIHIALSANPGFDYSEVPVGTEYGSGAVAGGLGYKGEWRDVSGLNYLRHRYYDPAVGRFGQTDPYGLAAKGTNTYAFCQQNPIGRSDPFGTDWVWTNGEWVPPDPDPNPLVPKPDFNGYEEGETWTAEDFGGGKAALGYRVAVPFYLAPYKARNYALDIVMNESTGLIYEVDGGIFTAGGNGGALDLLETQKAGGTFRRLTSDDESLIQGFYEQLFSDALKASDAGNGQIAETIRSIQGQDAFTLSVAATDQYLATAGEPGAAVRDLAKAGLPILISNAILKAPGFALIEKGVLRGRYSDQMKRSLMARQDREIEAALVRDQSGGAAAASDDRVFSAARKYQLNPKHGLEPRTEGGRYIGKRPTNPEATLADSIQIKATSDKRIAVDPATGEVVIFARDNNWIEGVGKDAVVKGGIYHGYVVPWELLEQEQKNALIEAGLANSKGLIKP